MPSTEDDIAALRDRVRELGDRIEIRELLDRYVIALDTADEPHHDDAWSATIFTDDVVFSFPIGSHTGLAGYARFQREARLRWARTHHISANHTVDLDGDRATARVHQLATHVHRGDEPKAPFDVGGYYEAGAVRTTDGWRLNRLDFHVVWATGELPAALTGLDLRTG